MRTSVKPIIGIDLGTTHTVMACVDELEGPARVVAIPQVTGPGVVESRDVLPSFIYLAAGPELPPGALRLPWSESGRDYVVGELARSQGSAVPTRLVASAKSWLCHPGVDRTAPVLPWRAPADVAGISPLDATTRILEHLRSAWGHAHGHGHVAAGAALGASGSLLSDLDVFLTVPASFDAVAREMTMTAAHRAGLERVTLLEEPQAAFYAWLAATGETWRDLLKVGDVALVCDVGGGTTDFSLIEVASRGGDLALERVAVGDHLMLGGDNMDLALAHVLAARLGGGLDAWQARSLWIVARDAKEQLLADPERLSAPVTVLGRGSRVVGKAVTTELTQADVQQVILDGFFPRCTADARPVVGRRSGIQEAGLPYASDPAVTRHLARFVGDHGKMPTAILFNGGVMKAAALRQRIAEVLESWMPDSGTLRVLESVSLDLAVAQGAAVYGRVRQSGKGVRIRGGTARSYYLGIEGAMPAIPGLPPPLKALCVVPFGMEEGTEADVPGPELALVVGEPAEFRFLSSTVRKDDGLGALLETWSSQEIKELAPVRAAMEGPGSATVLVTLHARVTEVGTLELELRSLQDDHVWKLEYSVREQQDTAPPIGS